MMTDPITHNGTVTPAAKSRRWRLPVLLLAAAMAVSAGFFWLLASTSGLRWAAATLVHTSAGRISLEGISGTLLGPMEIKNLVVGSSDLRVTARDIQLDWRPGALLDGRLEIAALAAQDVEVLSLPSPFPENLQLPLPLSLHKLDIGVLRVISKEGGASDFSASNLSARLESDGRQHRLQDLRASLEHGKLTASGQMDGTRPFTLQAQADLVAPDKFAGPEANDAHISAFISGNLMQVTIKAEGSGAGLTGTAEALLMPYNSFPLAALNLQVRGFNPRTFLPEAPKANLTLQADLRGNADGRIEGDVAAKNTAPAPINLDGLPLLEARAHATLSADLFQFDNLALSLAKGASISGHFAWQRERATGSADLIINRLDPAVVDTRLRTARLNGSMKLSGDETTQHGILALSDGTLHLDARLTKTGNTLALDKLRLARGQAALTGQGKLGLSGRRAYTFNGKLQRFNLAAFLRAPHSDLNATLELAGELEPQATGMARFMINDSRLADHHVNGSGQIEFVGMSRVKGDAELRLGDNRLSAKGSFGTATDRLQLDLNAPVLSQFEYGFSGSLNARASLAGSLEQPDATLEAEGRNLALRGEHHLASLTVAASLHGEALSLTADAAGYRDKTKTLLKSLQLAVRGSRSHHQLDAKADMGNDSKLTLRASGGADDPAKGWENMQWKGVLTELAGTGVLPFKLLASTPLTLGRNHVSLDTAQFAVAGGQVNVGSVAWTPQQWSSRGSFTGIGLRAIIGLQPNTAAMNGMETLRLGGKWDIAAAAQLLGSLHIARESGDWVLPGDPPIRLGLQTVQFTARAADGKLTGELTALGDRLGDLRANLAMPLAQSGRGWTVPDHAPLTGQIRVNVADLAWLGPAIHGNLKSNGRLAFEADVAGTFGTPRLYGQLHGDDLALAFLDQGVRLQQGKLAARFDQKSLHIDTLRFSAPHEPQPRDPLLAGLNLARGPGELTASGVIDLSGENSNLKINASRLPLSQRPDRWIVASGSGNVGFKKNMLTLGGRITVDAGLINQPVTDRPQLSGDIVIVGQQAATRKGSSNISVDATLDLGEHFYLRASGLEAKLIGQLSVRDAAGQQLRATGTIVARNASFEAYGQRLTVERGIVNFQGPLSDPGLNILALRKGLSVEAGVEVTGTALHPTVRLVSIPAVADAEKLSWIVLGRPPDATGVDTSLLLMAAGSILGGGSSGIVSQLKQTLGVDELSLKQTESDDPLSSQIVTVGKRISDRAFLSYEQGITAVAGVTKLTYTLTPRVNIVTQAGIDNAIDIFYTFSFE